MPQSNYLELRQAVIDHITSKVSIQTQAHSGNFTKTELDSIHLHQGDLILVALNSMRDGAAHFSLFLKLGHDANNPADVKALDLLHQLQFHLGKWKDDLLAKKIRASWQTLVSHKLAEQNCYLWRMDLTVPIYDEDYLEEYTP